MRSPATIPLKAYRQPKRSKVARRPMVKLADPAFQVIYSNIENGLLKGTSSTNQATVPKGRLLIIESCRDLYSSLHHRP